MFSTRIVCPRKTKYRALLIHGLTSVLLFFSLTSLSGETPPKPAEEKKESMTKVFILINNTQVTADLYDNATSKSFISLLPLTLTLNDYNQTEKISDLPQRLPVDGAPEGITPKQGILPITPLGEPGYFLSSFWPCKGTHSLRQDRIRHRLAKTTRQDESNHSASRMKYKD